MDLRNKPVIDFDNLKADVGTSTRTRLQGITYYVQESMQDGKPDNSDYPQLIPDYILSEHHKHIYHILDLIRAVIGYTLYAKGKIVKDHTYRGQRQIKIIECEYSTDGNIQEIIGHVYNIYEPLRIALQTYGTLKADVKFIPIVISRSGTLDVKSNRGDYPTSIM